ncbi:MAG: 50S ribosomal protein L11 methyltransferase [Syntrophales bacterium]|nr:50S ribosomal protein L11 methyltransferase [Syntrophales bacterium]
MAFGTGQHPSTRMCLEAMEDLILKEKAGAAWRVLDVGTGTGILGIAAAKLGAPYVMCVEIDKQAADIAQENIRINGVEDRVRVVNRDVSSLRDTFNLIVANLTAKALIKYRPQLFNLLEREGYLVISGIIAANREDIETHFLTEPLILHRTIAEKEWLCYVLKAAGFPT